MRIIDRFIMIIIIRFAIMPDDCVATTCDFASTGKREKLYRYYLYRQCTTRTKIKMRQFQIYFYDHDIVFMTTSFRNN